MPNLPRRRDFKVLKVFSHRNDLFWGSKLVFQIFDEVTNSKLAILAYKLLFLSQTI
jgi:catabolite regulation protein CreA